MKGGYEMRFYLRDELKIRLLIASEGKTLRGFSEDIGISHTYLSQILNQYKQPSAVVAYKIAKGLGYDLNQIFLIKTVDVTTKKCDLKGVKDKYDTVPNKS